MDEHADMMEALAFRGEHLTVDRGRVVVLDDELDHHLAEIAERVGDVCFLLGSPIVESIGLMMMGSHEGTRSQKFVPGQDRLVQIVHEIGLLEERIAAERHLVFGAFSLDRHLSSVGWECRSFVSNIVDLLRAAGFPGKTLLPILAGAIGRIRRVGGGEAAVSSIGSGPGAVSPVRDICQLSLESIV